MEIKFDSLDSRTRNCSPLQITIFHSIMQSSEFYVDLSRLKKKAVVCGCLALFIYIVYYMVCVFVYVHKCMLL